MSWTNEEHLHLEDDISSRKYTCHSHMVDRIFADSRKTLSNPSCPSPLLDLSKGSTLRPGTLGCTRIVHISATKRPLLSVAQSSIHFRLAIRLAKSDLLGTSTDQTRGIGKKTFDGGVIEGVELPSPAKGGPNDGSSGELACAEMASLGLS